MEKHQVFLHTGSNQGQRFEYLIKAERLIETQIGPIIQRSAYYETEAWGKTDQADFINQALEVHSELSPTKLLQITLNIEKELGRIRRERWTSRCIDIDLLFYDDQIINQPELTIPHPRIHLRNFVLIPMLEIAATFVHPVFNLSIEDLYLRSEDRLEVRMLEAEYKKEH